MNNKLDNLTILVNSCDSYEDLWDPFFKLFKKFGGELTSCPIVLNTESKKFTYDGLNITCPNNYTEKVEWGRRLKHTLNEIKTDYVFFLLDDFFLQRPANTNMIAQCLTWLKENENIGAFNFIPIEPAQQESTKYNDFCLMPLSMQYRFNAQACLWKKSVLNDSILDIESPWDWEVLGNIRNQTIMRNIQLYALKYGINEPYYYNFIIYKNSTKNKIIVHSPIMRSKWDLSCIEQCFKENDINIDYNLRGIYKPQKAKKSIIYKILRKIYHIVFWRKYKNKLKEHKLQENEKFKRLVEEPIEEYNRNNGVNHGK